VPYVASESEAHNRYRMALYCARRIFENLSFIVRHRIIPDTTLCKRTPVYDVTLLKRVYLQHGGAYCCIQNGVTVLYSYTNALVNGD